MEIFLFVQKISSPNVKVIFVFLFILDSQAFHPLFKVDIIRTNLLRRLTFIFGLARLLRAEANVSKNCKTLVRLLYIVSGPDGGLGEV